MLPSTRVSLGTISSSVEPLDVPPSLAVSSFYPQVNLKHRTQLSPESHSTENLRIENVSQILRHIYSLTNWADCSEQKGIKLCYILEGNIRVENMKGRKMRKDQSVQKGSSLWLSSPYGYVLLYFWD